MNDTVMCGECGSLFKREECKFYTIESIRGVKKPLLSMLTKNKFQYMGCPDCKSNLIFFKEGSAVESPSVIDKVHSPAADNSKNLVESLIDSNKPVRDKKIYKVKCDSCNQSFESKLEHATRCMSCINKIVKGSAR